MKIIYLYCIHKLNLNPQNDYELKGFMVIFLKFIFSKLKSITGDNLKSAQTFEDHKSFHLYQNKTKI